jgi:(2Fe-2S) ferredoxin
MNTDKHRYFSDAKGMWLRHLDWCCNRLATSLSRKNSRFKSSVVLTPDGSSPNSIWVHPCPSAVNFFANNYQSMTTGAAGVCHKKESSHILQHLTMEVQDRGLDDVMVSSTGCMNICDSGPVMVVYPESIWYKQATIETAEAILDSLEGKTELPPATLFA